ncbi:MAG: hypothetical protein EBY45_17300, partial [Gammaproteobacteria bacterium]|nr:hypothetical protein [Gammaproteobacteria bacterium]
MSGADTPMEIAPSGAGRLYRGQTAIVFTRRRRVGLVISAVLVLATVAGLLGRGLELGIDFEGGQSWDVPAATISISDVQDALDDLGVPTSGSRLQERSSD